MGDSFTLLVRIARTWRASGATSHDVVTCLVGLGLCTPEHAFLITRAVAVDSYMTGLDVMFEQPVVEYVCDYLSDPFPDLLSEGPVPESHPDE